MADLALFSSDETVRATVEAILGARHHIDVHASLDRAANADLVIADIDDDALAREEGLEALSAHARVLMLLDRRAPVPASVHESARLVVLRKPFDPFELRVRVDRMLAASPPGPRGLTAVGPAAETAMWLEFPYVPAPAGALLRRTADLNAPLWILGEPGCGRRRVAAAVTRRHNPEEPFHTWYLGEALDTTLSRCDTTARFTLYVPNVDQRSLSEQERLLAAVSDLSAMRLIASADDDPAEAAAEQRFSRGLYRALIGLAVQLSPLRERTEAIAPLARMLTFSAARSLGFESVTYSEEAMLKLQNYMWPGNIAELESVIHRTLVYLNRLGRESVVIEADEVRLVPESGAAREATPLRAKAGKTVASLVPEAAPVLDVTDQGLERPPTTTQPELEPLIAALAHSWRNPMVPIKTLAAVLQNGEPDADEARRLILSASGACDRLNQDLETLTAFAELGAAHPVEVDLCPLIREALAEAGEDAAASVQLTLPASARVMVDPSQAVFAVSALMDETLEVIGEGGRAVVRCDGDGTVHWEQQAAPSPVTHLGKWVGRGETVMTWRLALVEAITVRNKGSLKMETAGPATKFAWSLPVARGGGVHGRQTNRTHR